MAVALRPVQSSDLDAIFEQMRDPASIHLAAFTAEDPDDRAAFDEHVSRNSASPGVTQRAVTDDGLFVGTVASFPSEGFLEVTYWIDRAHWGRGIASAALALLLAEVSERPIRARVASDNAASRRVLEKSGFVDVATEVSYAPGRGRAIDETIFELREGARRAGPPGAAFVRASPHR